MTDHEKAYFTAKLMLRLEHTAKFFERAAKDEPLPSWIANGFGYDLFIAAGVQVSDKAEKIAAIQKHKGSSFPESDAKDALLRAFLVLPESGYAELAVLLRGKKDEITAFELGRIEKAEAKLEAKKLLADLAAYLDCELPEGGIGFEAEKQLVAALSVAGVEMPVEDKKKAWQAANGDENAYSRYVSRALWNSAPKNKREAAAAAMKSGAVK